MLKIRYKTISTPFHYPFQTAHGIKTHQPALLIALESNGIMGFGEAPAIHYYNISVESMLEEMLSKIKVLESYAFTEPDRFWHFCHHLFPNNHFLVCALDMAYWDMYSKTKRQRIYEIWNLKWEHIPLTDYTIGIDSIENMLKKVQENPYPIYKIKVGGKSDLDTIKAIRKNTDAIIRVDANAGWSLEEAMQIIPELANYQIELVEQPLAKDNWEGMKILKASSSIPLFADEACVGEHDIEKCAEYFHGVNIKLTKCGGITLAFRMVKEARNRGLKIMMGCMNETETGSYAIAQFLPLLDYVDMDGPLLLQVPPLKLLKYENGRVSLQ